MATNHDRLSRLFMNELIKNWRDKNWNDSIISDKVFGVGINKSWPCPDGSYFDPTNNISIGIEFKPHTENKRGIQTGIGQCITYLQDFSVSYLMCPEYVEGFNISGYLKEVYENNIKNKLPIGLITYDVNYIPKLNRIVDIDHSLILKESKESDFSTNRYWAKFVDTCPELIYFLLEIAYNMDSSDIDRRESVWKYFFDKIYFPTEKRCMLKPYDSIIHYWDKGFMQPFAKKIAELKEKVDLKVINFEEAIDEINQHCSKDGIPKYSSSSSDNLYKSYKKNLLPFIDHLGLWDESCNLSSVGIKLYHTGKLYGGNSVPFIDEFAKIVLLKGKHLDLILDINDSLKGKSFINSKDARTNAFEFLESKGYVKRNINRSSTGDTKLLSNEFQLWGKLGFIEKDGKSYFNENLGFNFNWRKISSILNLK